MPRPKKVEKQKKEEVVLDLRQDREEFLRAFEKPTQIYRFLRARHCISPLFLHRTLLYMQERCSRNNKRRKVFHVADMLQRSNLQNCTSAHSSIPRYDQLKIVISGFYIDPGVNQENSMGKKLNSIDAEVSVRKIYRSRRKDGDTVQSEEKCGVVEVPVNPRNAEAYVNEPVVLQTATLFQPVEGHSVKNYTLVFRVYESNGDMSDSYSESSDDADSEAESVSDSTQGEGRKRKAKDDPAAVSLKNLTSGTRRRQVNEGVLIVGNKSDEDGSRIPSSEPPRKIKKVSSDRSQSAIYEAELDIYTNERQILLVDGDYELSLTRKHTKACDGRKNATWEALDGGREIKVLSTMTSAPILKFKLNWTECDKAGPLAEINSENKNVSDEPEAKRARRKASLKTDDEATETETPQPPQFAVDSINYRKSSKKPKQNHVNGDINGFHEPMVYYQFIYNNESQQQTEARNDLHCPWCRLNCISLYGLIKHLKMTHPRFHFCYNPQSEGCCIEVSVNECYDGSYCGNPQFVFSQPGMAFSRRGPVRRIPVTDTLFYRSEKERSLTKLDPNELLEREENEPPPAAHYAAGHHRLYFHSGTNIPIRPCEFDNDSEEEPDPDWLKDHIRKMIDEFTDVNDGEKPIMKLWNLFIMKNSCIADGQMTDTCRNFLNSYGFVIHEHNLRRNLLLHLTNLVDFGVLKTSALLALMQHFDEIARREEQGNKGSMFRALKPSSIDRFVTQHEAVKCLDKSGVKGNLNLSEKSVHLDRLQKIIDSAESKNTETIV